VLHAVWYDEDTAGSQLHLVSVALHLVNTRNAGCTNTNCCQEDQIIISVSSTSCKNPILHILNWHRFPFYANISCVKGAAERSGAYLSPKMGNWNTEQCVKCCVKLQTKMISALFSGGYGTHSVKK